MRSLVFQAYEKCWDYNSGLYFYFNRHSQESKWEKPMFIGNSEDIALTPRTRNLEEAAKKMQALYRRRNARKYIKWLVREVFEKVLGHVSTFFRGSWEFLLNVCGRIWEANKRIGNSFKPDTKLIVSCHSYAFCYFLGLTIISYWPHEQIGKTKQSKPQVSAFLSNPSGPLNQLTIVDFNLKTHMFFLLYRLVVFKICSEGYLRCGGPSGARSFLGHVFDSFRIVWRIFGML